MLLQATLLKQCRLLSAAGCVASLLLLSPARILAQASAGKSPDNDVFKTKIGASVGFTWNSHSADFKELPGVDNCCPVFEGGEGTGSNAGISYEYAHFTGFSFALRLTYLEQNAVLKGSQEIDVIAQDSIQTGIFENSIAAEYSTLSLEPIAMYNPIGGLHVLAGIHAGWALIRNYKQKEVITEPQSGVFKENGKRIRNERSGEIPGAHAFQAALLFGVMQEFPLNSSGTILLAPEIILQIALTDIITGTEWKANALRAGIGIKYVL